MQTLLDIQESMGITPKALEDRPNLEGHLIVGYSVFNDVAAGRRYSAGYPLRLGPSETLAYMQLYNVPKAYAQVVTEIVELFDDAWIDARVEDKEAQKTRLSSQSA